MGKMALHVLLGESTLELRHGRSLLAGLSVGLEQQMVGAALIITGPSSPLYPL
jgi:hypothetical protein